MTVPLKAWLHTVPWLERLPAGWRIARFKGVAALRTKDNGRHDHRLLSLSTSRGIVPKEYNDENRVRTGEDLERYWRVSPGHLVVNPMWLAHGSVAASNIEGVISPDYRVYESKTTEVLPEYLALILRSNEYRGLYSLFVRGDTTYDRRVSKDDFHSIPIVLPPIAQQRAIATVVTRKTAAIDALIAKKERLLELLQEKRQALITRAVTKGLEEGVEMKDSETPLLGSVPRAWEIVGIKHVITFVTSGSRGWADFFVDDGPLFLQSGNLDRRLGLDLENVQHVRPPSGAEGRRTRVEPGDILVCITGALTGNVSVVQSDVGEAYVNQHIALVRTDRRRVNPMFVALLLSSSVGANQFLASQYGGTKQGLGLQDVRDVRFALPPRWVQDEIAEYVRRFTRQHDAIVSLSERQLEKLREYRQALITAAVTGKIDLSSEAA